MFKFDPCICQINNEAKIAANRNKRIEQCANFNKINAQKVHI